MINKSKNIKYINEKNIRNNKMTLKSEEHFLDGNSLEEKNNLINKTTKEANINNY